MTGDHIRKVEDGWEYPRHKTLLGKCGLSEIEKYIEKRRGTLWGYLEKFKDGLMKEAMAIKKHCRDPNKIFWWDQKYIK